MQAMGLIHDNKIELRRRTEVRKPAFIGNPQVGGDHDQNRDSR
jgi:hypothetical protein